MLSIVSFRKRQKTVQISIIKRFATEFVTQMEKAAIPVRLVLTLAGTVIYEYPVSTYNQLIAWQTKASIYENHIEA